MVTLLAMVVGVLVLPSAVSSAATTGPVRIMVVGDSISHGSSGDYTWRWFLARHLAGESVDMVGPSSTPFGLDPDAPGAPGVYQDPHFDSDHAAQWGDTLSFGGQRRAAQVGEFAADVVVLELGTNDLTWLGVSPENLIIATRQWVEQVRAIRPNVSFVLCDIPVTDRAPVAQFNELLVPLVAELDSPGSRVTHAALADGYVMGTEPGEAETTPGYSYDPLHPNTAGQQHIAAAVGDALATLGIGDPVARPLPRVVEPAGKWKSVGVLAGENNLDISWQRPAGATTADVWVRPRGEAARRIAKGWGANRLFLGGLIPCQPVEVRLRSRKGWTLAGEQYSSAPVTAVPGRIITQRPKVTLVTGRNSAQLTWTPGPGTCKQFVSWSWRTPQGTEGHRVDEVFGWSGSAAVWFLPPGSAVRARLSVHGGRGSMVSTDSASVRVRGPRPAVGATVVTKRDLRMKVGGVIRKPGTAIVGWTPPRKAIRVVVQRRDGARWTTVARVKAAKREVRLRWPRERSLRLRVRAEAAPTTGPWSPVHHSRGVRRR